MATQRRTPRTGVRGPGPRGSAGPRRGASARTTSSRPEPRRPEQRPRLTGRAAILVLVLAVLAVSWASSFRAYFQQRSEIAALRAEIADTEGNIDALEREKRRWQDDAFVRQQARERFGYVMPGERTYQVLDENGQPIDSPDQLADPDSAPTAAPPAWWDYAWESVEAAGEPVDPTDPNTIKAPPGEQAP